MNHYLKNVAAKNLDQIKVIEPRLASRFEPEAHRIFPAENDSWSRVDRDTWHSNGRYRLDQGRASDQDIRSSASATAKRSNSAFEDRYLDSPFREDKVEIENYITARAQGHHRRNMPISATKKISPDGILTSIPDIERACPTRSEPEAKRDRSPISISSERSRNPKAEIDRFVADKSESKDRPSLDVSIPFAPAERTRMPEESIYGLKPIKVTLRSKRSEENFPLASAEERRGSTEKKRNLKAFDLIKSENNRNDGEIVHPNFIGENKRSNFNEYGIRPKSGELIIDPLSKPVPPGMIAARSHVESYFRPNRSEESLEDDKSQTDPPVLVTIGRIEILAKPEVAAPQRKRTASPAMSLEDYLKIERGRL